MPAKTRMNLKKIILGGQTGVDRADLDWAIAHGIPHGGWCPVGRLADGFTSVALDALLPMTAARQ
ncbi:YpsA SLOG family protein [Propionivibrio sp.]|uniref:YpsA SLOG family protein n=1 Tax=Propionivibrio sp. TaxID=2212460 RepID=UPI003BF24E78